MEKAYLTLECGEVFEGERIGAEGNTVGELVFTTSMIGYLETLSDPKYYGQIVAQTFPLIGNYGVIPADLNSPRPFLNAYIVRELCQEPSNFRSCGDLDTFLKDNGVIGLSGIDTRALTRILRDKGTMKAAITSEPIDPATLASYKIEGAVEATTAEAKEIHSPDGEITARVAMLDLGAPGATIRELNLRGVEVVRYPASTPSAEILAEEPDGIVLTGGPGDPRDNAGVISEVKALCESGKPIMALGLGHQTLALASGCEIEALKFGHHGSSQPILDKKTNKVYITAQNHGYAVKCDTLPRGIEACYININDNTCEGLEYAGKKIISLQFEPAVCDGPQNMSSTYDRFTSMMKEAK